MDPKRRLTKVEVSHISLVGKGANRKTILWKSGDAEPTYTKVVQIAKLDEEQRIVYGIVYSPDEVDTQGDTATADVIKAMAYDFMEKGRTQSVDKQHNFQAEEGFVAESWLTKANDPTFSDSPEGSWAVAIKVRKDETWAAIKSGEITGLSLAGMAASEEVEKAGITAVDIAAREQLWLRNQKKKIETAIARLRAQANSDENVDPATDQIKALNAEYQQRIQRLRSQGYLVTFPGGEAQVRPGSAKADDGSEPTLLEKIQALVDKALGRTEKAQPGTLDFTRQYNARHTEAKGLLSQIVAKLDAHKQRAMGDLNGAGQVNYGYVADLGRLVQTLREAASAIAKSDGAADYNEQTAENQNREQIWRRTSALEESLRSILGDDTVTDKLAAILSSIDQFRADMATVVLKADDETLEKMQSIADQRIGPVTARKLNSLVELIKDSEQNIAEARREIQQWTAGAINRGLKVTGNEKTGFVVTDAQGKVYKGDETPAQKTDDTQLTPEEQRIMEELKKQIADLLKSVQDLTAKVADVEKAQGEIKTAQAELKTASDGLRTDVDVVKKATAGSNQTLKADEGSKGSMPFSLPG